jgi:HAD superfamily hydrolase (TIGR01509 family)
MNFRGVVFDLDGTMVDNMSFHVEAFAIFARRHGLPPLDMAQRARFDGKRNREIFPDLFGRPLSDEEQSRFADEKESLYRELSQGRLVPMPGLVRLLDLLDAQGVPYAVATSAPAENVPHSLGEMGLCERVTRIVRSGQVGRGKPAPDVFLAAAALLGQDPETCLAFEDAPLGVVAARAAGMTCVAITTSFSHAALVAAGAVPQASVADFDAYLESCGEWLLKRDGLANRAGTGPV